jgi:hypothetical protein
LLHYGLARRGSGQRLTAPEAERTSSICDGKVTEFWNASTDMYAYDELIG